MLTSEQLKQVTTEARPIMERQLEDAEKLAGLRGVVAAAGGDWGQLKALIKAQIKDENDDAGDGKHVRKILDKADYAQGYADMLGLDRRNLNEKNSFAQHEPAPRVTTAPAADDPGATISPSPMGAGVTNARAKASTGNDASPPAHAGEVADGHHELAPAGVSGEASRLSDGSASVAPILEPEVHGSWLKPAPEPVAQVIPIRKPVSEPKAEDRTKPNPICKDPTDCGAYGSWPPHTCDPCLIAAGLKKARA